MQKLRITDTYTIKINNSLLFLPILDNLLDDLQSSVIRSQNNSNYNQNYSTKSRDVEYLSPSNSTTVVKERSVSPGRVSKAFYHIMIH